MAIYDLFISYSSKDRPWAEKLYLNLKSKYPSLKIFWDRESIPAGQKWRDELLSCVRNSKHLVFLWSDNAKASPEVDPEIERFIACRDQTPELEGSQRKVFYVPLKGDRRGGVADFQGFDDFKTVYNSDDAGLGLSGLNSGQPLKNWERMIRMVGDAVSRADQAQEIIAAVAATNIDAVCDCMELTHSKKMPPCRITLDQFLSSFNLQWNDVKQRYGPSALDWQPVGNRTIVELLEEVRVRVNANLDETSDHFKWRYVDLTTEEGTELAENLHKHTSVVIFDPISLYDPYCSAAMRLLNRYVLEKQSVIISLSPTLKSDEDFYASYVRGLCLPTFDDYFNPAIPPHGEFVARCAPEVQRVTQIDRLVRQRIRDLHLAASEAVSKATTGQK
jgi:hypothetical protein